MTLDQLPRGQKATIVSLDSNRAVSQRLMAMGFLPGTPIRKVQVAPFGDPITVELEGWRVSLRNTEASLVHIQG